MHIDHVGWNLDEQNRPRFPKARYMVPKEDWDYFSAGKGLEQNPDTTADLDPSFDQQVRPLANLGVMDLISGETVLSPAVTTMPTPGHTPGHTSFVISSRGERALILGDVSLTRMDARETSLRTPWDELGPVAITTRQAVLDKIERENTLMIAGHYPRPGFGYFTRVDGRLAWRPYR
jgi:glyoxylase-like metal-dependent hydrolase (beta-lactamase superfamily II)